MTVFNRQKYVSSAIQSVLNSSFSDFEFIIVDDCSTDASPHIVSELANRDNRIHYHENTKNLGDYGNRAKAASLAKGKFLKYVDSDDLIYPHTLQIMVDAMNSCPEAGLALSHSLSEAEQPYPWVLSSEDAWREQFLSRGCLACGPTGAIIRRDVFEMVGGFRKEWGILADIELWLRLSALRPIVLIPPGLVWWRRHDGQEYSSSDAGFNYLVKGHQLTLESIQSDYCPLAAKERRIAIQRATQHHARKLLSLLIRERKVLPFWKAFKSSRLSWLNLLSGLKSYT
jgi:glycosyltransferase involved in cell wall biosynthesis